MRAESAACGAVIVRSDRKTSYLRVCCRCAKPLETAPFARLEGYLCDLATHMSCYYSQRLDGTVGTASGARIRPRRC